MVLIFGIGVETSMFMRMSTFVLALCLSLCCIILSHCIDARVVNDFVLDFLLHVQIQLTNVYMHVSIHKTQHTNNDVCIYVWRIYLWQNRNRQRTLLSVFAVSRSLRIPSNASPIPPRSNRSAMAAAMNRMSKKFQYLTNRFCSHQGYESWIATRWRNKHDKHDAPLQSVRQNPWLFELVATNIFQKSFDFGCFQGSSSCCESISAGSVVLSARKESNPQPQN